MGSSVVQRAKTGRSIVVGPTRNRLLVSADDSDGRVGVIEMELAPGFGGPPLHAHHELEHVWYVLAGCVRVVVGPTDLTLEAGGCVYVPKDTPHTFGNGGDTVARLLEVDSPRTLDTYFEELAAAIPSGMPADPELVAPILARHDTHLVTSG
jgi:mannose-6-phosphate isomerase-like protein (cupin superfamily)